MHEASMAVRWVRYETIRYLAIMLGGAAAVALMGGGNVYAGHHDADLPDLLVRVALLMVLLGLPGAWILFRPVARFLSAPAAPGAGHSGLRRLPALSAAWIGALAGVAIGGHLGATHGSWRAIFASGGEQLITMLAHVALFSAYIGLGVYLALKEDGGRLRSELWQRHGIALAPRGERLAVRLAIGLAAVAAGPGLLLFSDARTAQDAPEHHAMLRQALELDLLAAGTLTALLVVLVARSVLRPVRNLTSVMERVDGGDLGARAAVVSDDELGALTARFNVMLDGLAERERMQRTFSRFVPEAVANALLRNEGAVAPQELEASVLYTDIERFTDIAATLEPRRIFEMLNAYFGGLADVIQRHGGVITQFQGDAVLAVFNLPVRLPGHAAKALAAARDIAALEARGAGEGIALRTRVGVATGKVVGGTVGGGDRLGYTVHGNTVNLAARLEALNKELGSRVLCDGRTAELAGGVALKGRGQVQLQGFVDPVGVFELAGDAPQGAAISRAAA